MQTEVRIKKGGPYIIKGNFKIIGIDGKEIVIDSKQDKVCICACGRSKNMPFCDGAHDKTLKQ